VFGFAALGAAKPNTDDAEWYSFLSLFVFALGERKNEQR
jgi:hypothetical protein